MSTIQKNSSEESQESSSNPDKSQLSLSRCNSVDSKAHLVVNVCKTAQARYSAIPASRLGASSAPSTINSTAATTNYPQSTDVTGHTTHNLPPALRIQLDCEGGILNTAFIDNGTAGSIHFPSAPQNTQTKKENSEDSGCDKQQPTVNPETVAKTLPLSAAKINKNQVMTTNANYNEPEQEQQQQQSQSNVQLRRHSAYAQVYRDLVNDSKCNLNQRHATTPTPTATHKQTRPASYIQTIVTKNGYVTTSVPHETATASVASSFIDQHNLQQTYNNTKEQLQAPQKRTWFKAQK